MSLYNIKQIPLLPVIKIYAVISAITSVLAAIIYFIIFKLTMTEVETLYLISISAGLLLGYFILGLVVTILVTWLYNIAAPQIGGVEIDLEAKE